MPSSQSKAGPSDQARSEIGPSSHGSSVRVGDNVRKEKSATSKSGKEQRAVAGPPGREDFVRGSESGAQASSSGIRLGTVLEELRAARFDDIRAAVHSIAAEPQRKTLALGAGARARRCEALLRALFEIQEAQVQTQLAKVVALEKQLASANDTVAYTQQLVAALDGLVPQLWRRIAGLERQLTEAGLQPHVPQDAVLREILGYPAEQVDAELYEALSGPLPQPGASPGPSPLGGSSSGHSPKGQPSPEGQDAEDSDHRHGQRNWMSRLSRLGDSFRQRSGKGRRSNTMSPNTSTSTSGGEGQLALAIESALGHSQSLPRAASQAEKKDGVDPSSRPMSPLSRGHAPWFSRSQPASADQHPV